MNKELLSALDNVNQAAQIAHGLRGLMVEFETKGAAPTSDEVAALAALAEAIGDKCRCAAAAIEQHAQGAAVGAEG